MLYSIKDLLSMDYIKSAIVLTVIQFHFRLNVYWHMLQTILDGTVDVIFCSGGVVDLYWRLYIGGSHCYL